MTEHFRLLQTAADSPARLGELITSHGTIPTPAFMPVGSQGTVKTVTPDELRAIGIKMILANAYHLYLRPGMELMRKMGGLHKFMNWDGAILTDSGGYQIFSLTGLRKLTDEGVTFRSHIDGSEHFLTPESVMQIEETIGADVIMALDECPDVTAPESKVREAVDRTSRWAKRCHTAHTRPDQQLFAIVQGGLFPELRWRSASELVEMDFPGYAVGGLSLGESKQQMYETLELTTSLLPANKTRYFMGVGSPEDIIESVARGVDIFDSVLPTRVARNGAFFTAQGRRNIRNAAFREAEAPLESVCDCYTCRNFSTAYIHHLFSREELLAYRLTTIHNLAFMHRLMVNVRAALKSGTFSQFRSDFISTYRPTDEQTRIDQKQRWIKSHGGKEESAE